MEENNYGYRETRVEKSDDLRMNIFKDFDKKEEHSVEVLVQYALSSLLYEVLHSAEMVIYNPKIFGKFKSNQLKNFNEMWDYLKEEFKKGE